MGGWGVLCVGGGGKKWVWSELYFYNLLLEKAWGGNEITLDNSDERTWKVVHLILTIWPLKNGPFQVIFG